MTTQAARQDRGRGADASDRIPEEGELVEVRGQSWVVARVEPAPAASGRAATLVHLQSVADGRFGDTLSVIWEVEPGRRVLDRGSLPDAATGRFDPPSRLAAFLDAVRWSAVASADVRTLQAPFRSGVAVEPYQLEPVSRAVGAPRVNLLLADDVGLGKTIEAGLVIQELLLRGRAHRIMIVCPAGLTLKWRDEMHEKFGLDFTIVDSEHCARLRRTHGTAANPFRVHPLTIVSLPWLRGTKAQRLLDEVIPDREETGDDGARRRRFFDLLVLDEAHHVAPAAPKQVYAVDSQQTKLIRRMVPHFEHRLFLSATPHNGYPESYTALLELIDNQKFARGVDPDKQSRDETVVRRLKVNVTNPDGTPRFRIRQTREIPVEYTELEREVHGLLGSFADLRKRRMAPKARGGRRAADLVTLLLKKRLFSSPAAFLHTVKVYLSHLDDTQGRARSAAAEVPDWLDDFADLAAELDDLGLADAEDDALTRSTSLTPQEDGEELNLLRQMERWALTHEAAADSKADALINAVKAICRPDQHWTNERVVIFTEYRDTQKWLFNLLQQHELTDGERVAVLHGGLNAEQREQIRLGFQAHPATEEGKVRILLATDAASEGIDLQNHCHRLFNYDIPFNPNKLEQRIGRVDRWGQKHDPEISHFIGAGWEKAKAGSYEADLEFLSRVARKVARMEEDLGSVNAVIADAVQRRMTGDHTPVDIENAKAKQIAGRKNTGGTIAAEQNVTAQAKRLADQYQETVDTLGLNPTTIKRVVDTALELDHQQPLAPHYSEFFEGGLYEVPPLSGTWERATRGLAHKLRPAEQRPVTFDPQLAAQGRDDIVLAHLKHPLVALSTRLLTAAVWNADGVGLHRVAAVVSDDPNIQTTLVSAYARYVLVGADGTRLHEEILYAGGWFGDTGRFRRWDSVRTQGDALARALTDGTEAAPGLRQELTDSWSKLDGPLYESLAARARERRASLETALAARRAQEEDRIKATLDRFEATLRAKLKEEGDDANEQIALFGTREVTTAEQRQYREDRERWQDRIRSLGAERERELATIAARYREPRSHLFPVAVVFVIPAKEARR
ncbi:DISARM system SNF2-like helicase DrmD [Streptomyces europaeiscabiei]|uniref:DISARM system SNF2-like helicase DrmD n=1 Tax=Streptomyces TaxID=1883 RepID=UPI000A38FEC7|nr:MULTISPECIES: DISARM system SNF2-like helicase DrmD [Streptomyces]MDX3631151.1 DISARM system SNF2-like helicase DrmD [Streptomyces europaeiscabiei]MDX3647631.1 DISARM system SNF2-like helicase DrmD [Streptomyces europaeiscabiei]